MSSFVKNLYPERLHKISIIIGNGYCLRLMTLFSWCKLLIQNTLPSFLGMMNEGDAHSLSKRPILTRWLSSVLKVFKWIQGTGYDLECAGLAFGSMSMCTFLCGYTPRVPSNILLFSCSTQSKSAFWCAFRWVSPFMTSTTSVCSYLASRTLVVKHLSQSLPESLSLTWMWNVSSMASNLFESKFPGGWSGMEQSNQSMFPSE